MYNVSQLNIFNDAAEAVWTTGKHRFTVNYQDQFYSSADSTLHIYDDMRHEQALNTQWHYQAVQYQSNLKLGANFRGDSDYVSAEGSINYILPMNFTAQLTAGYNVLSTEGAAFRLAGLTDTVDLRFTGELSKREFYSVYLRGQEYKTRLGTNVGYGYGTGFEAGYRLFFEHPGLALVLHANWKHADLVGAVPVEWQKIVAANTQMKNIINPFYDELGLDLRLNEGEFRLLGYTDRSFRYFMDAGIFYSEPTDRVGTKLQAGIGTRLFKDDEISLSGNYTSIQGGVQSIPSTALELRYSKRFD